MEERALGSDPLSKDKESQILLKLFEQDHKIFELCEKTQIKKSLLKRKLKKLRENNYVVYYLEKPKKIDSEKVFSLTEKGKKIFPNRSNLFLLFIVKKIKEKEEEENLDKILGEVKDEISELLWPRSFDGDLKTRIRQISKSMNEFGFHSILREKEKSYEIRCRNCVFGKIIEEFGTRLCKMHRDMIDDILPTEKVELKKSMEKGDLYCSISIEQE